jgi:hypothetical protein
MTTTEPGTRTKARTTTKEGVRFASVILAALALLAAGACGGEEGAGGPDQPGATTAAEPESPYPLPQGSEPVKLDPADFVPRIDNPYWPLLPGSRWVYRETDSEGTEQRVEVVVTDETKSILGIEVTVVHDVVSEDGEVIEDTFDWYAQDTGGTIWYLGEDTKEFENGKVVSTEGSWEAGVDGAQAGVILPGEPKVGMAYRQEYYAGEAEDNGEILSLDEQAEVPFGSFDELLMTEDTTPLEPDVLEHKFYARGVGLVLALALSGGGGREELLRYDAP